MGVCRSQFELIGMHDTRLAARSWEPEDARVASVGIVHGLGEHSGRYDPLATQLAEAGYRVLAFDQRGHGLTKGQRGHASIDALRRDIVCLVKQLQADQPEKPCFLLGHSLGGGLLLSGLVDQLFSIQGAVVLSPLLLPAGSPPSWKLAVGNALYRVLPRFSFSTQLDPHELSHDPVVVQAYIDDPLVHGRVSACLGVEMLAMGRRTLSCASELSVPTLLMHGSADPITACEASREFAQVVGDWCAFRVWDGLYHELHGEQDRAAVVQAVLDWLRQQLDNSCS